MYSVQNNILCREFSFYKSTYCAKIQTIFGKHLVKDRWQPDFKSSYLQLESYPKWSPNSFLRDEKIRNQATLKISDENYPKGHHHSQQ